MNVGAESGLQVGEADMVSRLAHELRTPLGAVLGLTHLVACEEPLSAGQLHAIRLIEKACQHMLGVIQGTLCPKLGDAVAAPTGTGAGAAADILNDMV
jgi:His Kinase A (phospho-acceptor) domain